jgi:hypothetical protein
MEKHQLTRRLLDNTEAQLVSDDRELLGLDPPDVLHHYTSPSGLLGILKSGNLWLTDALFLNDQSELSYGRGLVTEVLRDRAALSGEQLRTIFEYAIQDFEVAPSPSGIRVRFYVTSFCENGNLLSQWRAYAASGYSLGFDATRLKSSDSHGDSRQRIRLRRIEYRPDVQRTLINRIVDLFSANVCSEVPDGTHKDNRILGECFSALIMLLWSVVPQLKDPVFEEEHEWRLVYTSIQDKPLQLVEFRQSATSLVPYISVDLRTGSPPLLPLVQITHAPSPEPDLTKAALRDLLKSLRYPETTTIAGSNIPLRKL